jgi:transcriptional regulator with XRE-family HTH domain
MTRVSPSIWQDRVAQRALAERDVAGLFRILQGHGLSQRQIADLTDQHQSEINDILGGRKVTSVEVLERIADGLAIPRQCLGLTAAPPPADTEPVVVAHWRAAEIRALRHAVRMSIREFGEHLGVSARMVSNWEGGYAIPRPASQAVLDAALRIATEQAKARFASWPTRTREIEPDDPVRWVVHIVAGVHAERDALDLADHVATLVAAVPQIDPGEMSVSREDQQLRRVRVYCDRRLTEGRCTRRTGHTGGCG